MLERFEKFSLAIWEISRYWNKIASDEMEKHGLKAHFAVYFITMSRFEQGITAAKLSELCSRDKAEVSRVLSLMEKKGLVCRQKNQNHYRAPVRLSEEGRKLSEVIKRKATQAVELGGMGIPAEQRESFYTALDIITENLRRLSRMGLPEQDTLKEVIT